MIQGTIQNAAWKIVENGFGTVASLDEGYYGKGIYFTTYALYSTTYIYSSQHPVMIISWVLPGNTFPVSEHHKGSSSLLGQAIKAGYNSHYVVAEKNGFVPSSIAQDSELYDELVVSQEGQIAPAFIVHLDHKSVVKVHKQWIKTNAPRPETSLDQDITC